MTLVDRGLLVLFDVAWRSLGGHRVVILTHNEEKLAPQIYGNFTPSDCGVAFDSLLSNILGAAITMTTFTL